MADGKREKVVFTRPAADRIAKVVRKVESGDRSCQPLVFERVARGAQGIGLKLGTYTGAWSIGEFRTVTMHGSTQTANVKNWCVDVGHADAGDTANTTKTRYVIFGTVKGTHSAVEIQQRLTETTCTMTLGSLDLTELTGYVSGQKQLLGHDGTCLLWFNTITCAA